MGSRRASSGGSSEYFTAEEENQTNNNDDDKNDAKNVIADLPASSDVLAEGDGFSAAASTRRRWRSSSTGRPEALVQRTNAPGCTGLPLFSTFISLLFSLPIFLSQDLNSFSRGLGSCILFEALTSLFSISRK